MQEETRRCCEIHHEGRFTGLGAMNEDGSVKLLAGRSPDGATVSPIDSSREPIALIADVGGRVEQELRALYPGRVMAADGLDRATFAVVACEDPELRASVDWQALEAFARSGRTVIASLDDYAHSRGLTLKQRARDDRPLLEIVAEHDLFRGCRVGDMIPWHNVHLERPIFPFRGFRYLEGFVPDASRRILARDNALKHPRTVEETVEEGRIVALDLLEPRQDAGGVDGSRNKWVLPGNILGGSVRYSRWWPRRLSYEAEYPAELARLRSEHAQV